MKAFLPQLFLFPVLAWLIWSADIWTAVSLMFPAYIIVALFSTCLLLVPCAWVPKPIAGLLPLLWLVFLLILPFVNNSSLKPLMRGMRALQPGMDRDTVLHTLEEHYAGTPYPLPVVHSEAPMPKGGIRLCIKPQGRPPELQAESLLVFLEEGQFRRASFSAD